MLYIFSNLRIYKMYKTSVTFTNYLGKEVTQELEFNLSAFEADSFQEYFNKKYGFPLDEINDHINDGRIIFEFIKDFALKSYGVLSSDGNSFVKDEELEKVFKNSLAFENFVIDMASDTSKMTKFFEDTISDLQKKTKYITDKNPEIKKQLDSSDKSTTEEEYPKKIDVPGIGIVEVYSKDMEEALTNKLK